MLYAATPRVGNHARSIIMLLGIIGHKILVFAVYGYRCDYTADTLYI